MGHNNIQSHITSQATPIANSPQHLYHSLPKELQPLCGYAHLTLDGGASVIHYLWENDQHLVGCGNSSLKDTQCSHAWVLSTGGK
jgi:hypothetical protein